MSRLETQSTLDANIEAGNDLIQVVSEPNCCNICSHYSYKVFSISGTDPTFSKFTPEKEPIYHPHCRCYVVAVVTQDQVIKTDHGELNYTAKNQRHIAKRHKKLVNKEHWIKDIVNNGKSYKENDTDEIYYKKIDDKYYKVVYNYKEGYIKTFSEMRENQIRD